VVKTQSKSQDFLVMTDTPYSKNKDINTIIDFAKSQGFEVPGQDKYIITRIKDPRKMTKEAEIPLINGQIGTIYQHPAGLHVLIDKEYTTLINYIKNTFNVNSQEWHNGDIEITIPKQTRR